jgi:hypothetical protein
MYTNVDARNYVIECIQSNGIDWAAEFDVDKIVSDLHFDLGTYNFVGVPPMQIPDFWETVECYKL